MTVGDCFGPHLRCLRAGTLNIELFSSIRTKEFGIAGLSEPTPRRRDLS